MFSGSTTDCLGGDVGEGRKEVTAGEAAKDGAEFLSPEVPALAAVLDGKLEKPPCKTELTDVSDSCKGKTFTMHPTAIILQSSTSVQPDAEVLVFCFQ